MITRVTTHRMSAMCGCIFAYIAAVATPSSAQADDPFHGRLEVSPRGLCVKGIVVRKTIPLSDLQISFARILDLGQEPDLRPGIKLYGVGLPGFRSGWFLLRDRERALVLLAGLSRAVYLPTSRGYALLLSPDRPEEFLAALQSPAPDGQVFTVVSPKRDKQGH